MSLKKLNSTALQRYVCSAVLFLSGCTVHQRQMQSHADPVRQQESRACFVRSQARMVDIPIPAHAAPCVDWYDEVSECAGSMLQYMVASPAQDIIRFYTYEMERMGWQCLVSVHAHEDLLVFDKPERLCTISIRPVSAQVLVVVSTGAKDIQS